MKENFCPFREIFSPETIRNTYKYIRLAILILTLILSIVEYRILRLLKKVNSLEEKYSYTEIIIFPFWDFYIRNVKLHLS